MADKNVVDVIKGLLHEMEDKKDLKQIEKIYLKGSLTNGDKVSISILIKRI